MRSVQILRNLSAILIFIAFFSPSIINACIDTTGAGVCQNSVQSAYAANILAAGAASSSGTPTSDTTGGKGVDSASSGTAANTATHLPAPVIAPAPTPVVAPPPPPPESNPITNPTLPPVAEPTPVETLPGADQNLLHSNTTTTPITDPNIGKDDVYIPGEVGTPSNPTIPIKPLPLDYSCSNGASANKNYAKGSDFCSKDCPEGMFCDSDKCLCKCNGNDLNNPIKLTCDSIGGTFNPETCTCTSTGKGLRVVSCSANTNAKDSTYSSDANAVCDNKCKSINMQCEAKSCTCVCKPSKKEECLSKEYFWNDTTCICTRPPPPVQCWSNSPANPRYPGYDLWSSRRAGATCDGRCPQDPLNPNKSLSNLTCSPRNCTCVPRETLENDTYGKSPVTCSRHPGIYDPEKNYCIDNCAMAFGNGSSCNASTCACDRECVANRAEINCSAGNGSKEFNSILNYCRDDCNRSLGYYCAANCSCVQTFFTRKLNFSCSNPGDKPRRFIYGFDICTNDCTKEKSEGMRCDNFTCNCTDGACGCAEKADCLSNGWGWSWNGVNCSCIPPSSGPEKVSCIANTLAKGANWKHSLSQVCTTTDCPKGKVCEPANCLCVCDNYEKTKCAAMKRDGYTWDEKACVCREPASCANNNARLLMGRVCKDDCSTLGSDFSCNTDKCECMPIPSSKPPAPPPGFLDGLIKWLGLK